MANKWLKQLRDSDAYVPHDYDAFSASNIIRTPSPGLNWIFANKGGGIPRGCGVLFFSERKAGKSLLSQAIAQQIHQDDSDGIVLYYSTEYKGKYQKDLFKGIDPDRLIIYDTSKPADIFDHLAYTIQPMVQDGMPLRMVIIDSISAIGGVKAEGKSVEDHLIGDKALTITRGLDMIIPFLKKNNITYITVAQIRANIGVMYGPDIKAAIPKSCEHNHEYFVSIKRAGSADDKKDIEGNNFENSNITDARGNKDTTGHKIYVKMEASSLGTEGRAARITIDYKTGIINQHEEIFDLGKNTGVIEKVNNVTFAYKGQTYRGKKEMANAIKESPELAKSILEEVAALDNK